jgi:hypothetical protein
MDSGHRLVYCLDVDGNVTLGRGSCKFLVTLLGTSLHQKNGRNCRIYVIYARARPVMMP